MNRHLTILFAGVAALGLLSGCGDGRPERVPVSGRVLIDGQSVAAGAIRFHPQQGRPATGTIKPDGSFVLSTFEEGDGAIPGNHTVTVLAREAIGDTKLRWYAPKKYGSPNTSGLSQSIDGATDSVVINLTWDSQAGPFEESRGGSD